MRWSPCDSPLHEKGGDLTGSEQVVLQADPSEDSAEADEVIDDVYDVAIEALQKVDQKGAFGTAAERAKLVLNIWTGDQNQEDLVRFAYLLNDKEVAESFERELEDGYRAFYALLPSPP